MRREVRKDNDNVIINLYDNHNIIKRPPFIEAFLSLVISPYLSEISTLYYEI